ncbi:hypothetical protein GWO43_16595 [candidate division KSB1 bacterium]|nr:hypothetical protein [candidate division KSB1 bacterium]NIR68752.1 hypothetical protein [candidate division KSB1 bacterium]NIS25568.1 hypothetical protein [candidate division KSB1 bacterium]NIT72462.1 hypothetical protein [candidate division KSB1 bacterium]NIU26246.1 hypothetical protein [candidate division KSB1 bacterium]
MLAEITTPWNTLFDVGIDRTFHLGRFPVTAYAYVQNVFNRKNVQHVYWRTGNTGDDGTFTLFPSLRENITQFAGEEFFELYELINLEHRQHYQIVQGGDLFGRPREIRFGLQVGVDP